MAHIGQRITFEAPSLNSMSAANEEIIAHTFEFFSYPICLDKLSLCMSTHLLQDTYRKPYECLLFMFKLSLSFIISLDCKITILTFLR
jgi:hypothetical protein